MNFKESKYYDEKFLGKTLYDNIVSSHKIFTVKEYFGINNNQKKYHIKDKNSEYKLKLFSNYYELSYQESKANLFLVFDKPVHIVGKYCKNIIAPEIIIKSDTNISMYQCVTNKTIIDNALSNNYTISYSKIKNIYFHNSIIKIWDSEINNFFIFNKDLYFENSSYLPSNYKIKCFGSCDDLKEKMLRDKNFKKGIIHIK